MSAGISLHIGLNRVDPAHYAGWDGRLAACEFDARDMAEIAAGRGFTTNLLLTGSATVRRVTSAIRAAAVRLAAGDVFLLTYSGHGGQVPDRDGDEAGDRRDETWILYDREIVDDELNRLWAVFRTGVRIVVVSDSCHSGTVTRAPGSGSGRGRGGHRRLIPDHVQDETFARHRRLYAWILRRSGERRAPVRASVLLLAACQDDQFASDGDRNGLFTSRLREVWRNGAFRGTYRGLHREVLKRMPAEQTPRLFLSGASDPSFPAQAAFTLPA